MRSRPMFRPLLARGVAVSLAAAVLLLLVPASAAQVTGDGGVDGDGVHGGPVHVPIMLVLGPWAPSFGITVTASKDAGIGVCWHFAAGPLDPGTWGVFFGDGVVAYVPFVGPGGWQPLAIGGLGTGTQEAGADPSC